MTPRSFIIPLTLCALIAACGKEAPPPQATAAAVTVVTLKSEPVTLTRELPGRAVPYLVAEVRPQVSGIVKQRLFAEGSLVKAGQPLYQLDDATYRADAGSAKAALARAQATLEAARLAANRSDELAKIEAISKQEHERLIAALRQAEADVGVAKAALDRATVVVEYGRIAAPISGRIGKSAVTVGALVTANQTAALTTIQQIDPLYIDINHTSAELLQLQKQYAAGTLSSAAAVPVTLLLEDGTAYPYTGSITFSDITVDATTGSFAVRVTVKNPDHILLPGMYVRAVIGEGVRNDAILAPQQGISRDPKGNATALVVGQDGKAELRQVKAFRTIGKDKWLVEEGLAAGDRVIVEGLQKVRPGMPVNATEQGANPAPAAGGAPAAAPTTAPAAGENKAPATPAPAQSAGESKAPATPAPAAK